MVTIKDCCFACADCAMANDCEFCGELAEKYEIAIGDKEPPCQKSNESRYYGKQGNACEVSGDGTRRTGRAYRRKQKRQKTNKRIAMLDSDILYNLFAMRTDCDWVGEELRMTGDYVKFSKKSHTKYYKLFSNRKVRRYKGDIPYGSSYQKIFDYSRIIL